MEVKSVKNINKWFIFPDLMSTASAAGRFLGYMTREDITFLRGAFPIGQNIQFTTSRNPTVRPGSKLIGAASIAGTPVLRAWTFERRDGIEIEMKVVALSGEDAVYFRIEDVMDDFALLEDGFNHSPEWTYCVISETADINSRVNFCSGLDEWRMWTGVYGLLASFDDVAHTLTISGDVDLADLGFAAAQDFVINGISVSYTSISGKTFSGCGSMAALTAVAGDAVVQKPTVMSGATIIKSSLAFVHDGRIHARSESKKSVSFYSMLDNPDDWTPGSTDGDGGAKEIEQGGPITAYAHDEKQLYIFKKKMIKTLEYIQGSTRIDVPKYGTLKPTDDKSITTGALGAKSTFHAPNGIIFTTPDKQLIFLKRDAFIDYPQQLDLADPIRPTFQVGVHDEAAGVVFNSKVYYAYKADSKSAMNDVVIVYDLIRNVWHAPYLGWNVADWTIVNGKLHWHASNCPNTYELQDDKRDGEGAFTSIIRSWQENFGYPVFQKKVSNVYLELFMLSSAKVKVTILYDIEGVSGQEVFILDGSKDNISNSPSDEEDDTFGTLPFGSRQFGSNADLAGMKRYRYVLELKNNVELFDIAVELQTDDESSNYELIRLGYFVTEMYMLSPMRLLLGPSEPDNLNLKEKV